jgi:mono/diheme cytochrome c family protein
MQFLRAGLAAALLGIGALAVAQEAPAGSAERGQALFNQMACYSCHGTQGQGGDRGAGPRIAPDPQPYPVVLLQLRNPRQDMPAYIPKWVSDQDVADIYAYLQSIPRPPALSEITILKP